MLGVHLTGNTTLFLLKKPLLSPENDSFSRKQKGLLKD